MITPAAIPPLSTCFLAVIKYINDMTANIAEKIQNVAAVPKLGIVTNVGRNVPRMLPEGMHAFIEKKITYPQIARIVRSVLDRSWNNYLDSFETVFEADKKAREYAMELI